MVVTGEQRDQSKQERRKNGDPTLQVEPKQHRRQILPPINQ